MSKKFSRVLVYAAILLSTLLIPAAHATKPEPVSGDWFYTPYMVEITKVVGGNTFKYGEENGIWGGNFDGTSTDSFNVIVHPSGFVTCQGEINFEGTVNGEIGTMVILFIGKKDLSTGLWSGKWVIIGGTDDLANLNGHGTWEGPGWTGGPDPGELIYEGMIHFDPS
jgi:hypothetical protein